MVVELEMTLGGKLKSLREELKKNDNTDKSEKPKKWTLEYVANHLGKTKALINQYESDITVPPLDALESIAKLYKVSLNDLTSGNNELSVKAKNNGLSTLLPYEKTKLYLAQLPDKEAELYVPYYNVEITAGRIEMYFDDVDEIPEGYVYAPQYPGCVMCNVKGNSMYNLIYPGARLYVYKMSNFKYIDFGQIYLIVTRDNYRVLKYIRRHPSDDKQVRLVPHNPEHDYWDVEKSDILHLFLVKGYENQTAM